MRTTLSAIFAMMLAPAAADAQTYKVAWYNIKSGMGQVPLSGRTAPFATTYNCTDHSQPLNAWGKGLIQAELRARIASDPDVLALGLAEAWRCGSPQNVGKVLGWSARTGERNGIVLLARHGFAAPEQWIQLDTSLNPNPGDTKWVVRAAVCANSRCTKSVVVFAAHWLPQGDQWRVLHKRQARATINFMSLDSDRPHLLIGDLNTYEGNPTRCRPLPNNAILPILRAAGYVDAWPHVHGRAEGHTGMTNRNGCGQPEGAPFKRIDYAWVRGFRITGMSRFAAEAPARRRCPTISVSPWR